jgi:hypothetical protein
MKRVRKVDTDYWHPLFGADIQWTGNVGKLSYLLGDGTVKTVIVSNRDIIQQNNRIFINKETAKQMNIKTC